jgi:hypothetical protein
MILEKDLIIEFKCGTLYFKYEHNDKRQRKVYMCTQSSNYSPSSIPSLLDGKSIASFIHALAH